MIRSGQPPFSHRFLVLLLCFSFLFPPPAALAHGDHGDPDFHELVEIYHQVVDTLRSRLVKNDDSPPNEEFDSGFQVRTISGIVRVDASSMNQLLALASLQSVADEIHPVAPRRWSVVVAAFLWKALCSLPLKAYNFLQDPIGTIRSTYRIARAFAQRTYHGYDLNLVLMIVLSQGLWEGFESLVMPGGVHVACAYFNMLLLAVTVPLERVMMLAKHQGAGLSLWQRVGYGTRSYLKELAFALPKSRSLYWDRQRASLRLTNRSFDPHAQSDLDEFLRNQKFWAPVALTRIDDIPGLEQSLRHAWLLRDLDVIFDDSKASTERFYVALTHAKGMALLTRALESLASTSFESKMMNYTHHLRLQNLIGKMRYLWTEYNTALLFYAANPLSDAQKAQKVKYSRFLKHYLNTWARVGLALHELHEYQHSAAAKRAENDAAIGDIIEDERGELEALPLSDPYVEEISSADRATQHLLRRLLVLRKSRTPADRAAKRRMDEEFQRSCAATIAIF